MWSWVWVFFFVGVAQGRNTISGSIQVCSRNVVTTGDEKLKVCQDVLLLLPTGLIEYSSLLYKLCLLLDHITSSVCMPGNVNSRIFFKKRLWLKLSLITNFIKTHEAVPSEVRHP